MRGQEHTTSPRPAPMMAEVGVSISGMPGPPCGPSYRMMMTCSDRPPQNTQIRLGRTNGSWSPFLSRPTLVSRRPANAHLLRRAAFTDADGGQSAGGAAGGAAGGGLGTPDRP